MSIFCVVISLLLVLSIAAGGFFVYTLTAKTSKLEKETEALKNQTTELSNAKNELSIQLANAETQITALSADKSTLETNNILLEARLEELSELDAELTAIQARIAELEKKNTELMSKNESLSSSNSSLTSKNNTLASELSSLKAKNNTLTNQLEQLKELLISLGGTVPDESATEANESAQASGTDTVKIAYLTFDDGPSKYTDTVLDTLSEFGINATFFPNWKSGYKQQYIRMVEEGHALGNHTYSHEYDDVYTTVDGFKSEVTKLTDAVFDLTGYLMTIFRFPGGSNNTVHKSRNSGIMPLAFTALKEMGMTYYDWNVNSGDADSSSGASKETIVSNVLSRTTQNKAVILMHDTNTKGTTVAALREIIEGLIEKGYTFGTLTDDDAPVIQSRTE